MHILFAIGRILLVLVFVVSGAMKLLDIQGTAAMIAPVVTIPEALTGFATQLEDATGMKVPQLLAILAGVVEIVSALLIAFNIGTRAAAFLLILFTVAATFYFHAFWNMSGEAMQTNMAMALKNLSIIGGLLIMMVLGPWRPVRVEQL
jgi:uncharacterized membrane protein YphA (DoxX/SURF4 family)